MRRYSMLAGDIVEFVNRVSDNDQGYVSVTCMGGLPRSRR